MSEKSIIIIGAGVAGLTTGIYAQMNGYQTQIFEKHIKPGGLCTSWERKGYVIDGCLHWLVGSSPDASYHHMWQEVGALQDKEIINMDQFYRIEISTGKVVTLYTDADQLEKHLKEIGPEDAAFIAELAGVIRRIGRFEFPVDKAVELYNPIDYLKVLPKMLPFMGTLRRWSQMTMKDLADRFQNPTLKEAFQMLWEPDYSCIFLLMSLAYMHKKNAGYVIGGSLELALSMEKRYFELGGKVNYKTAVEKILIENNRAVGIKLADGSEHKADYVISAADGHATIFDMLEGKYLDDKIRGYYETMPIFQPLVYIGLGINRSFTDLPKLISGLIFPLDKPLTIGKKEHTNLSVHIYNFDPSFAAEGKTVLTVLLESDFAYWDELRKDLPGYKAEKERIAAAVVSSLNKRFPGFNAKLEMWDVATPVTFKRYTGNWQGSYEGWLITAQTLSLQMKKNLPGLANFYMVGQWVNPGGGLPSGLITGNHIVQLLCKKDKQKFKVTEPVLPANQAAPAKGKVL